MAKVSARSRLNLDSVDPALGQVVLQALQAAPPWLDFAVISGRRTREEQQALWRTGRDASGMIVDTDAVVTFKDGINLRSRHQSGRAVDIVAYVDGQISWDPRDNEKCSAYVIGYAAARGIKLTGGIEWGWDHGHIELEQS